MKKRILVLISACGILSTVGAREIRTPLVLQQGAQGMHGYIHTPVELEEEFLDDTWQFEVWSGAYAQSADQAYDNCHNTRNIAKIFFGKESFHGADVFADATISSTADAAATWLSFATLTPRVEYHENGAVFGGVLQRAFKNGTWRVGARASIPYKAIAMQNDNCDCGLGEEALQDVCRRQSDLFVAGTDPRVTANSTVDNDWAYRLDFISALCSSSCTIPLVQYGTGAGNPTRIHGKDVTDTGNLSPDPDFVSGNPVHLRQVAAGNVPTGLLAAAWNTEVSSASFLDGAGGGPGVGNRTRFSSTTDYTALSGDGAAQSKFWLVPTLVKNGAANSLVPTDDANEIRSMIEQLSNDINTSAASFFAHNCFSFETQKTRGFGDLDTEIFAGYQVRDNIYAEAEFGVRWPTGRKQKHPELIFKLPAGNNGHYEIDLGLMGWWKAKEWGAIKADASYHWVLDRKERVAAAFSGATVKNINPLIDADISWRYFIFHLDGMLTHPENPGLGFNVGYEFYWKQKDDICFKNKTCSIESCDNDCDDCDDDCDDDCNDCCNGSSSTTCVARCTPPVAQVSGDTATDFFGVSQTLNPCVLEKHTKRISHKARVEFFHHWNFGDLFAGWTQVFHGKNAMKETTYYLGMNIVY